MTLKGLSKMLQERAMDTTADSSGVQLVKTIVLNDGLSNCFGITKQVRVISEQVNLVKAK